MIDFKNDHFLGDASFLFAIGAIITHRRYGYRGIIVARDAHCEADEQWYQSNQTQPNRRQPWYHVLVDQAQHHTYVAESNLRLPTDLGPIVHPLMPMFFTRSEDGSYLRNDRAWPL